MIRRFLFYTFILGAICFGTWKVYESSKPDTIVSVIEPISFVTEPSYTQDTIDEYIKSSEDPVSVLFYSTNDLNSVYVFNSILNRILENHNITEIKGLVYCDITDMKDSESKNRWGFYHGPAFINLSYSGNSYTIHSTLEWTDNYQLTYRNIENWLANNHLIDSPL